MTNKLTRLELTWPGKEDRFNPEPRILLEDKEKSFSYEANTDGLAKDLFNRMEIENTVEPTYDNMLIHGDNLLALKALEQDYTGKIKCIYIDPPYNTGNAFEHYDDGLEHSIWLSLMRDRLEILKRLLSEDGFFCCEIDDSEGQYLKVLLDEIFGRNNYLTTIYVQVRYADKTLKQDMDFHKQIEQIHIYRKNYGAKPNLNIIKKNFEKYNFYITEKSEGEEIILGGKRVVKFKPQEYEIYQENGSEDGRKEIWASGTILDGNSSGRFFRDYLTGRYSTDGYGVLYKVYGIGDDKFDFRYFTGPKKEGATKGKYYQGVPLEQLNDPNFQQTSPIENFIDLAGAFGNCRLEGGVDFRGGKKPEVLLQKILTHFSNPGDIVLDSFLGSGTTMAVAHKMGRRWIGIEMGDQCYSHCLKRIKNVIQGNDSTGVTKATGWTCGGGFKFYELASSLIIKDKYGQQIISDKYNADMLAEAMCKVLGYHYKPDTEKYWKQGYSSEKSFIYTTTMAMQETSLEKIASEIGDNNLLICCSAFIGNSSAYPNITVKKIPSAILKKCEWGREGYPLNLKDYQPNDEEFEFNEENEE